MKGDSRPPRIFDQIIEMMFPLSALGHFDFDARLLPVQSIDDPKYESSEDAEPDSTEHKRRGAAASDDEARNRNLVGRDSCSAKARDDRGLDWRMNVRGEIERAVLSGIQNDALSQTTVLCPRRWKTEWPHAPTHRNDVIILRRRIDGVDLAVGDLVFKFLKKRRSERKREEKIPCDQCRSTRTSD
jgi:hypothetical protein